MGPAPPVPSLDADGAFLVAVLVLIIVGGRVFRALIQRGVGLG